MVPRSFRPSEKGVVIPLDENSIFGAAEFSDTTNAMVLCGPVLPARQIQYFQRR